MVKHEMGDWSVMFCFPLHFDSKPVVARLTSLSPTTSPCIPPPPPTTKHCASNN